MQEMVRFAKTMVPSLYKPVVFFNEMISNNRESFKSDVNKQDLYDLVSQILQRARDGEYGFEHLQLSTSRVHRSYRPFTEKTVYLLQRILADLVGNEASREFIAKDDLKIITKILSYQQMSEYLFKNSAEADVLLNKVVDSL